MGPLSESVPKSGAILLLIFETAKYISDKINIFCFFIKNTHDNALFIAIVDAIAIKTVIFVLGAPKKGVRKIWYPKRKTVKKWHKNTVR